MQNRESFTIRKIESDRIQGTKNGKAYDFISYKVYVEGYNYYYKSTDPMFAKVQEGESVTCYVIEKKYTDKKGEERTSLTLTSQLSKQEVYNDQVFDQITSIKLRLDAIEKQLKEEPVTNNQF